jgi:thiosulfate reductase cytochrome b subunit
MARVKLYAGFLRFWHWTQALLVIVMLVTGFNIHGSIALLSFEQAVDVHTASAWILIGLWVFAWFWHLTTGEWKCYIPSTRERIWAMVCFYGFEIFQGKCHPFHKCSLQRHNPLQSMTYLALYTFIFPAIWISGLLYLFYAAWPAIGLGWLSLGAVALIHTGAAFLMLAFLVAHIYLTLTMSERFADLKAMCHGYQELEEGVDREDAG